MDDWTQTLLGEVVDPAPVGGLVPEGSECRVCGEDVASAMAPGQRLLCRACRRAQQRETYRARSARTLAEAEAAFRARYPAGKTCPGCEVDGLGFDDFHPAPGQNAGIQPYCRACKVRSGKRRPATVDRPTVVYHLIGEGGEVLYVGKAVDLRLRLITGPAAHAQRPYWRRVRRVDVAEYETERAALAAEAADIERLRPPVNRISGRRGLGPAPAPIRTYSTAPHLI